MKAILILSALLITTTLGYTQDLREIKTTEVKNDDFANQGDQEIFWAIKMFAENYKQQNYAKYNGDVKLIDDKNLQFGNHSVEYLSTDSLKAIFKSGLLYPQLLGPGEIRVTDISEAYYVAHSPQRRRFKLTVSHKGFNNSQGWVVNPSIYFFELTNKKATTKTPIAEFIQNAKLTFLKDAWVQM